MWLFICVNLAATAPSRTRSNTNMRQRHLHTRDDVHSPLLCFTEQSSLFVWWALVLSCAPESPIKLSNRAAWLQLQTAAVMLATKKEAPFFTRPRLNLRCLASCLDLSIRPFTCQSTVFDTDALCHCLFFCFLSLTLVISKAKLFSRVFIPPASWLFPLSLRSLCSPLLSGFLVADLRCLRYTRSC